MLEESNLESNLDTDIEVDEKKVVTDMFPKPGVKVNEGSSIILYYNNNFFTIYFSNILKITKKSDAYASDFNIVL